MTLASIYIASTHYVPTAEHTSKNVTYTWSPNPHNPGGKYYYYSHLTLNWVQKNMPRITDHEAN